MLRGEDIDAVMIATPDHLHSVITVASANAVTKRGRGIYDAAESFRIEYFYKNRLNMTMFSTTDKDKLEIKFIGEEGWGVTQDKIFKTYPKNLRTTRIKNSDKRLYVSTNHQRNFIDPVKSRHLTAAPEISHRAATCYHIGAIAAEQIGQELVFDPKTETFTNNDLANSMLMKPLREPWALKV
ncbi:MAG: hypothetical protein CMI18_00505 [Opitutaceae bacterium]|nr:hypothetical protein [Opitutaceae bacterium]